MSPGLPLLLYSDTKSFVKYKPCSSASRQSVSHHTSLDHFPLTTQHFPLVWYKEYVPRNIPLVFMLILHISFNNIIKCSNVTVFLNYKSGI